jgi:hypothetical protein
MKPFQDDHHVRRDGADLILATSVHERKRGEERKEER